MSVLRDLLKEHVASVEGKDAEWGVDDCTPWCASWVRKVTGVCLIEPDWHSWEEAKAKIDRAGSLCALWDETLVGSIMEETLDPKYGDIGIIARSDDGQVSGIFLDQGRFVWRVRNGIFIQPARPLVKAWTFRDAAISAASHGVSSAS